MNLNEKAAIIDWVSYIILCILACYFIVESDVIQKHLNKNTDTYETEIQSKEFTSPEFTFCDWSRKILGLEYDVGYYLNDQTLGTFTKVETFTKYPLFEGYCFIITPQHEKDFTHTIHIRFNASIPLNQMPQIAVYVNSKNNPLLLGTYHDGRPMEQTINHQEFAYFNVNEERTKHLPGNCRVEPILDYVASEFIEKDLNCSAKCLFKDYHLGKAFEDKLKDYPVCKDYKTTQCIHEWARNVIRNAKSYCNKISYTGPMNSFHIQENDSWCSKVATYAFVQYLLAQRKLIDNFMR